MPKLTKPQKELLSEIVECARVVNDGYKPAIKLVELGLAEWSHGNFGSSTLHATPAGRAAMEADDAT